MLFFRIHPSNAECASTILYWSIPSVILEAINKQFMAFCMGQDILQPFGYVNILGVSICFCVSNWLVSDYNVGVLLFPICIFMIEVMNFFTILVILIFMIDKKTLSCVTHQEVFSGFKKFIQEASKFITTMFLDDIQIELSIFLAAYTYDQVQITAYVSFINMTTLVFCFGQGIAVYMRTNVGNYIGEKRFTHAKNCAYFCLSITYILGTAITLSTIFLRSEISE